MEVCGHFESFSSLAFCLQSEGKSEIGKALSHERVRLPVWGGGEGPRQGTQAGNLGQQRYAKDTQSSSPWDKG